MTVTVAAQPEKPEDALLGKSTQLTARDAPSLAMRDLAAATGLDYPRISKHCAALGIPTPTWTESVFSEQDLTALIALSEAIDLGTISEAAELSLVRAISQTAQRLAWWQVETILAEDGSGSNQPLSLLRRLVTLSGFLQDQMLYAWRRHMSAITRWVTKVGETDLGQTRRERDALPLAQAVGFADLVGYTEFSGDLSDKQLDNMLHEFEWLTQSVVCSHGGRVVKTLGDAILFIGDQPANVALAAVELSERIGADGRMPKARLAMCWGRVLPRCGDVFGPTVNLAARLVEMAGPGEVWLDEPTAIELAERDELSLQALSPVAVEGIGEVMPYRLARQL
ncbi:MAG: adenylate/guanylate cyclase domain-containing protein [Bifidobacteriaceae bacterium]|nr:adenylate/guanylate cyclase domain-containing protein [Bifidobacteriaceae bacterium]